MIYEKRLLVLSGSMTGCLRLEKTGEAATGALTCAAKGECVLVVRDEKNFLCFGPFGPTGAYKFSLPVAIGFDSLVAAVGDMGGRLLMSGGFRRPLPWRGSFEDDIKTAMNKLGLSRRESRDINDFFLDIIPTDYDDTRVAEVNYYRSNLTQEGEDCGEEAAAAVAEPARQESLQSDEFRSAAAEAEFAAAELAQPAPRQSIVRRQEKPDPPSASEGTEPASSGTAPLESSDYSPTRAVPELAPVSFYESVKDQLDRLFEKNERFEKLERLLPDSRWLKVSYDGSGKYYLIGTLGTPVRYLCYGVPGDYSPTPPSDLVGYCQWLAEDPNDPAGKGFWLMYQDGVTGKSVL